MRGDEDISKEQKTSRAMRYLQRLAYYRPNDAIRIAMEEGGVDVGKLRLEGVSEFKRHANGAVEIKFFDRLKALELLLEQQEDGGGRTASLSAFLASAAEGEDE